MERRPMNGFGEPNMGNPSVRFDEGRERVGHWPVCLSIHPFPPTLLARIRKKPKGTEMKNPEFCGLAQKRTKETKAKSGDYTTASSRRRHAKAARLQRVLATDRRICTDF